MNEQLKEPTGGWEVYLLIDGQATLEMWRFIEEFIDRSRASDRGDEEVVAQADRSWLDADRSWFRTRSIDDIVRLGFGPPRRAFVVYDLPTGGQGTISAALGFTTDGYILLGLLLDSLERASDQLTDLIARYPAEAALVSSYAAPTSLREAKEFISAGRAHRSWVARPQ